MFVMIDVVSTEREKENKRVRALIDTGANITCISPALAAELNLVFLGNVTANTASDRGARKMWEANLRIIFPPTEKYKEFRSMQVMETYSGVGRILLGMDIIEQGELHIKDRRFTLKF